MIIYKATNLIDGKVYIGQTIKTLHSRKAQHIRDAMDPKRRNVHFHNAIHKYGVDSFIFEKIDTAETQEELDSKERYWISFYRSNEREFGYNEDSGGKSGGAKSERTKRKIGDTTIAKWSDEETATKMMNGLRRGTEIWKEVSKSRRVLFVCPYCGKEMLLTKWETKSKSACSKDCKKEHGGFVSTAANASKVAAILTLERSKDKRAEIKNHVTEWCLAHKEIIANCKYNAVRNGLSALSEDVFNIFGIKDLRSIAICFNTMSTKDLLKQLKNIIS